MVHLNVSYQLIQYYMLYWIYNYLWVKID